MAAFQEVFRRSGIDERRSPPGMVVPFGGANMIDPGKKLKVDPNAHALEIKEIDGAEIRKRVMQVRDTFSEPDVDKQLRAASRPATFNGDARFFEIKGRKKTIGFPGLEVVFRSAGQTTSWSGFQATCSRFSAIVRPVTVRQSPCRKP